MNKIYTPIEYLESTGTQWINTNIIPNTNTSTELKIYVSTANSRIFGEYEDGKSFSLYAAGNQRVNNISFGYNYTLNKVTTVYTSIDSFIVNGQNLNRSIGSSYQSSNPIYLFSIKNMQVGTNLVGRYYYCKIYENDLLVGDFIPVRDQDGVPCMYDKVTDEFFYNQGTGQFIAGPIIKYNSNTKSYKRLARDKLLVDTNITNEAGSVTEEIDSPYQTYGGLQEDGTFVYPAAYLKNRIAYSDGVINKYTYYSCYKLNDDIIDIENIGSIEFDIKFKTDTTRQYTIANFYNSNTNTAINIHVSSMDSNNASNSNYRYIYIY